MPKTKPKSGVYRGSFKLPYAVAKLAKHAAVDEDLNLSEWIQSLVYRELRNLGALGSATPTESE